MHFERILSFKNLKRKPARTAGMILLSAMLAFSAFGGSLIVTGLQNGLASYKARLGADIVLIPQEASQKALDAILLQGVPGYFYMDASYLEQIRSMDGIDAATPQFFLASASAGCCSAAVQLIGFDPNTDFTIQPWIRESYEGEVGYCDIIVGSRISVPSNRSLKFYDTPCRVVAQLDETGTGLDTAVYASMGTIRTMMKSSAVLGFSTYEGIDADSAVSSIMVAVSDGYSISDVTDVINRDLDGISAVPVSTMISGISDGLHNISRIIGILLVMIWILAVVILVIAFVMISHERAREFAVLRTVGASRRMLSRLLLTESAIISLIGSVVGVALAFLIVLPFSSLIRDSLDLPYLLPGIGRIAALALGSIVLSVTVGALTSARSAHKISSSETWLLLREDV